MPTFQKPSSSKRNVSDNQIEGLRDISVGKGEVDREVTSSLQEKFTLEREALIYHRERLGAEETELYDHRQREVKDEITALTAEVRSIAKTTGSMGEEISVAIEQNFSEPNPYHLGFLKHLLLVVQEIQKSLSKIENSVEWLIAWNTRLKKKGHFWATYSGNNGGSKFLLSSEHYVSRSSA